jgi:hypothetical protein
LLLLASRVSTTVSSRTFRRTIRRRRVRFAIVSAGGVGGYFGGKLAAAGADVVFVARGAHLAAIQDRGLEIEGPGDTFLGQD